MDKIIINGESFRVDASWQGGSQLTRIENQRKVFEQIISKNHESYVYLDVEQIKEIITGIGEDKDKDQLVEDAFELLKDYPLPSKVRKMIQENENDFEF